MTGRKNTFTSSGNKTRRKKRAVVKVGTGVLTREDGSGRLSLPTIMEVSTSLAKLADAGVECLLVSSGAVGAGLEAYGLKARPTSMTQLQACAAVGQSRLVGQYENFLRIHDYHTAQVLLTHADLHNPVRRVSLKKVLGNLLGAPNIIPILNENDSVEIDEFKFGDNDLLSAEIALLVRADILILLTNADALLENAQDANKPIIGKIKIADAHKHVDDKIGKYSVGGMTSKLEAAEKALRGGVPRVVIGNGRKSERILEFVEGKGLGTFLKL